MNIQLTGDSLMARFEGADQPMINQLLEEESTHTFYNTAVSGNNTFDFLKRIEQDILSLNEIDKIFILLGANDLAIHKQIPLNQFSINLQEIITKLTFNYSLENIYFISPSPVDETKQKYRNNFLVEQYSQEIKRMCDANDCGFINLYQAFIKHSTLSISELTEGLQKDGIHFGLAGYHVLAQLILKVLN